MFEMFRKKAKPGEEKEENKVYTLTIMFGTTKDTEYLFVYSPTKKIAKEYHYKEVSKPLLGVKSFIDPLVEVITLLAPF